LVSFLIGPASCGCIRLTNEDVIDLYNRTPKGTKVIVLATTAPAGVMVTNPTLRIQ
jgi:hypothetical protein